MGKVWRFLLVLGGATVLLAACASATAVPPSATPLPPKATPTPNATEAWQAECLKATVRALEMERRQFEGWLKGASGEKAEAYRGALAYLDAALAKYRSLPPAQFRIASVYRFIPGIEMGWYGHDDLGQPKPITLDEAWVDQPLPGLLYYTGETRSGPFYTVVGVRGGDLSAIRPGVHYRMVLQPLMPAAYPFPSVYVCVKQFEEVGK